MKEIPFGGKRTTLRLETPVCKDKGPVDFPMELKTSVAHHTQDTLALLVGSYFARVT